MKGNKKLVGIASALTLLVLLAVLAGALYTRSGANAHAAPASFKAHTISVKPIATKLGSESLARPNGTVLFTCQNNYHPVPVLCYGPDQIRKAYGLTSLINHRGITGAGRSIIIVDAFGSPTIASDFAAFNAAWGLPSATLNVIAPFGIGGSDPGWALETSLDVEWSHVMAPGATINLVVAATNSDVDLYNAIKYAVDHNLGDSLSQSFGENESCADPALVAAQHGVYHNAELKGISVFASSGDFGSAQPNCAGTRLVRAVSFPADDPLVTAVGGTALTANAVSGRYVGETAWNESGSFGAATGGGFSAIYGRPAYQNGVEGQVGRGVPDVAWNASINGGVLVFETVSGTLNVFIVGGTSVASPEWAGLAADGAQLAGHGLGFLNRAIYRVGKGSFYSASFNDITFGDNVLLESGITGFKTRKGWDPVTGWGSPKDAYNLLGAVIGSL